METPAEYHAKPTASKSAILSLLEDRPIAYHPLLARVLGGVKQAVFVSQLLYWTGKGKRGDGYIWKTQGEWTDETGLSAGEQRTARKHLVKSGVLQEKLKSVPARLYYRLDTDVLQTCLEEYAQQDMTNPHNKDCGTLTAIPEITTEITTQREEPPLAASPPADESTDVAETEAMFEEPPPKPKRRTTAEHKAAIGRAVVSFETNGGRPGVADPTQDTDPWADGPLSAFCAAIHATPDHIKPSEKKNWPRALAAWSASWEDAAPTPAEAVQCMKGFLESELNWMTFKEPYEDGFKATLNLMLNRLRGGLPWNAKGKRNGGSSTGRKETVIAASSVTFGGQNDTR